MRPIIPRFVRTSVGCVMRTGLRNGILPQPGADLFRAAVLFTRARFVELRTARCVLGNPRLRVRAVLDLARIWRITRRVSSVTMRGPPV